MAEEHKIKTVSRLTGEGSAAQRQGHRLGDVRSLGRGAGAGRTNSQRLAHVPATAEYSGLGSRNINRGAVCTTADCTWKFHADYEYILPNSAAAHVDPR